MGETAPASGATIRAVTDDNLDELVEDPDWSDVPDEWRAVHNQVFMIDGVPTVVAIVPSLSAHARRLREGDWPPGPAGN